MKSPAARIRIAKWSVAGAVGLMLFVVLAVAPASADSYTDGYVGSFTGSKVLWSGSVPSGASAYMALSGSIDGTISSSATWPTVGWVCGATNYFRDTITTRAFVISSGNANSATLGPVTGGRVCSYTWASGIGNTITVDGARVTVHYAEATPAPSASAASSVSPEPTMGGDTTPFPSYSAQPSSSLSAEYWLCWSTVFENGGAVQPLSSPVPGDATCVDQNGSPAPSAAAEASAGPPVAFVMTCSWASPGAQGCSASHGAVEVGAVYQVVFTWSKGGTGSWSNRTHRIQVGSGAVECEQSGFSASSGSYTCASFTVDNSNGILFEAIGSATHPSDGTHTATFHLVGGTGYVASSASPSGSGGSGALGPCYETRYEYGRGAVLYEIACPVGDGTGTGDGGLGGNGEGTYSCSFPDGSLNPLDYFAWIGCLIGAIPAFLVDLAHAIVALPGQIVAAVTDYLDALLLPQETLGDHIGLIGEAFTAKVPFGWVTQLTDELAAADVSAGSKSFPTFSIAGTTVNVTPAWTTAADLITPYRGWLVSAIYFFLTISVLQDIVATIGGAAPAKVKTA